MLERNYKIDNIRFLAMFLVVFAHMIELFADCEQNIIYRTIYSFHMPLFIFISGYVAKFDKEKIFFKFLTTYFVFQTLYKVFDCLYVQGSESILITYSNPYWFLWYLFVLIIYYLLIPVFDVQKDKQLYVVLVSFVCALILGFDTSIGYEVSLSRMISFFPFFLMGYYSGSNHFFDKYNKDKWFIFCSLFGICTGFFYLKNCGVPTKALYHVQAYSVVGYSIFDKIMIYAISLFWIVLLMSVIPNIKVKLFTFLGQHTFYVYLLQGFIIKILAKNNFFTYNRVINLVLSISIVFAFYISCSVMEYFIKKIRKTINIKFFTEELIS